MVYAQSKSPWYSSEVQARYIEGRRAVQRKENKLHWVDVHKAVIREFPEDKGLKKYGHPSERRARTWAKENPGLPEYMRERGYLRGLKPLEYKLGRDERGQPRAVSTVADTRWWWSHAVPQPVPFQNSFSPVLAVRDFTNFVAVCMVLALIVWTKRLLLSSL